MKARRLLRVLFAGLSAVSGGCAQETPSDTASLAGRAVLLDGQPVEGAEVSVWHRREDVSRDELVSRTLTGADGRFRIPSVPAEKTLWVFVNKSYAGLETYSVGAPLTLKAGEARTLPVLKGGRRPPPIATPENAHLLDPPAVPPGRIDRFVRAIGSSGYHRLARMGADLFKPGLRIPDHAERFKAFPSTRPAPDQVRYVFFSTKGEAGAAEISLFVVKDTGEIVKFSNVEATF